MARRAPARLMDKRQSKRFAHFEVIDRYQLDGKTLIERGRILDISDGGVMCKWSEPLQVGDRYKFRFEFGGDLFFVEGEVTRTGTHQIDKKPVSGVRLDLNPQQRERLATSLARSGKKPIL